MTLSQEELREVERCQKKRAETVYLVVSNDEVVGVSLDDVSFTDLEEPSETAVYTVHCQEGRGAILRDALIRRFEPALNNGQKEKGVRMQDWKILEEFGFEEKVGMSIQ